MAYTKTIWADGENKYNITDQSNNILSALENVKLTNIGSVGTPISAANLNNIESEVKASSDRLASILATQSDVSIGTNSTQAVTPLTLRGLTIASAVPSENLRASSDSIAQVSSNSVYVKKKAFTIVTPGTYRVKFDMQSSGSGTAYCLIYKNGVAFGTERSVTTSGYVTFTEDLVLCCRRYLRGLD